MRFIKKNGIFINGILDTRMILNNIYLSMFPLVFLFLLKGGIQAFLCFSLCLFFSLFSEYIFYIILNKRKSLKYLITNNFSFLTGFIIFIFLPSSYKISFVLVLVIASSFIKCIQGGLFKYKISPFVFSVLMILIYQNIYHIPYMNITIVNSMFTYLYIASIIIAMLILVYNHSIKGLITITYLGFVIILSIFGILFDIFSYKEFFVNIILLNTLLPSVYLITDSIVSPLTKKGMVIYAILGAVLTIILHQFISYGYSVIAIFIVQLLSPYIDEYVVYKK